MEVCPAGSMGVQKAQWAGLPMTPLMESGCFPRTDVTSGTQEYDMMGFFSCFLNIPDRPYQILGSRAPPHHLSPEAQKIKIKKQN